MKNPTIILRTTNNCNLACKYCYDKENGHHPEASDRMFLENINHIVDYIQKIRINTNDATKVILHGGEPLLISATTYNIFFRALTEKIGKIALSVQTNGTLLSEEIIELFKKYNVSIGISLDGSDEFQNANRVYKNNTNSFKKVFETIKLLNNTKTKFGIIMTVTKNNIGHERDIYNFILDNHIYCSIRPAFPTYNGDNETIMTNQEYENFFKNLFDIWYHDNSKKVRLRQILDIYDEFIKVIDAKKYRCSCSNSKNCFGNFLSLDINGDVYSCNRTYHLSEFFLGNLNETSIKDILKKCQELKRDREQYIKKSECINCKLYRFCYGGCPANSYELYRNYRLPYQHFCEANRNIHNYIEKVLEQSGQIEKYREKIGEIENEQKNV